MKRRELKLTSDERAWLEHFTGSGSAHHQAFKRAQILLAADEPNRMGDAEIALAVGVSRATIYNVRSRYLALGVVLLQKSLQAAKRGFAAPVSVAQEVQ